MKLLLFIAVMFTQTLFYAQNTATIQGKVTDEESGELLLYANVVLYKGENLVVGGQSDFDGNYTLPPIEPGTYDLQVSYVGFKTTKIEGIKVFAGKIITINVKLEVEGVTGAEVVVNTYQTPLVEQDNTPQSRTVTAEDIDKLPSKSISGIVAAHGCVSHSATKKEQRKYKRIQKREERKHKKDTKKKH